MRKILMLSVLIYLSMILGCSNQAQTGSLIGAGVGAAGGAAIDHNNRGRGALIGGGLGAAIGYVVGNEQDKK